MNLVASIAAVVIIVWLTILALEVFVAVVIIVWLTILALEVFVSVATVVFLMAYYGWKAASKRIRECMRSK